jgi:hypothetical protein
MRPCRVMQISGIMYGTVLLITDNKLIYNTGNSYMYTNNVFESHFHCISISIYAIYLRLEAEGAFD